MIDVEKFLISLRNNKDADGRLNPIRLDDELSQEVRIVREAIAFAKRPWVGLTAEEFEQCYEAMGEHMDDWALARAIEAKLKEKNT